MGEKAGNSGRSASSSDSSFAFESAGRRFSSTVYASRVAPSSASVSTDTRRDAPEEKSTVVLALAPPEPAPSMATCFMLVL